MKIHKVKQGSEEWFDIKLGKLSASNAQAISANGAGLVTLIYKTVAEILSGAREDTYINPDMERGNEQEDTARSAYEMETGSEVTQVGFCELDKYTGASPDGLVGDDGLFEVKCPKASNYVKLLHTKKIDTGYVWQMQMQMLVTGRKWVDYVVYHENFRMIIIIRVERDEAAIKKIKVGLDSGIKQIKEILEKVGK